MPARLPLTFALPLALLATLAALALPACDGERPDGVYAEMLRLVPDEPETRVWVKMGDVERFTDIAGVDAGPTPSAVDYLRAHAEAPSEVPSPGFVFLLGPPVQDFVLVEHTERYFGIALADVEQWVAVGEVPPFQRIALRGSFEPATVDGLLAACAECPEPERIEHRGTVIYAWADDFEMQLSQASSPPAFDELGRGCCVAVQDRYALRAVWREGVTSMLDAQAGDGSLADDEDFRLAAEGLDELGTLSALLTERTQDVQRADELLGSSNGTAESEAGREPGREQMRDAWSPGPEATLLRPYTVIGIGAGYEDGEQFTGLVLVHADEDDARENARRFAQRLDEAPVVRFGPEDADTWGEAFDRVQVEVDGRVLRARLWGLALHESILRVHEPLFLHE